MRPLVLGAIAAALTVAVPAGAAPSPSPSPSARAIAPVADAAGLARQELTAWMGLGQVAPTGALPPTLEGRLRAGVTRRDRGLARTAYARPGGPFALENVIAHDDAGLAGGGFRPGDDVIVRARVARASEAGVELVPLAGAAWRVRLPMAPGNPHDVDGRAGELRPGRITIVGLRLRAAQPPEAGTRVYEASYSQQFP